MLFGRRYAKFPRSPVGGDYRLKSLISPKPVNCPEVGFEEIPRKPMSEEFDGGEVLLISRRFRSWGQDGQERVVFRRGSNLPSRYNTFISPCFEE